MPSSREPGSDATFAQALAALKRRGCNVLLAGGDGHVAACRRLLGDDGPERRHRLFVFTERGASVDERVSDADAPVHVVENAGMTRGGAAAADAGDFPPGPAPRTTSVQPGDLAALGNAVGAAIDGFDDPDPAQLRVCVDSLRPLLDRHDRAEVFRLVHGLTNDVRRADAMGHFHLPAPYDDDRVDLLAPLFDAVVEVRTTEGGPEQRWHMTAPDVDTGWLGL